MPPSVTRRRTEGFGGPRGVAAVLAAVALLAVAGSGPARAEGLTLAWEKEMLRIRGDRVPGGEVVVWYLEAFCRPGSTDRDWKETVIPHTTRLVESSPDGKRLRLRNTLEDGVIVDHEITASDDDVTFRVSATNPTDRPSLAHWAQPCVRVDRFVGVPAERDGEAYLPKCFVYLDGKPTFLPTAPWTKTARYTPGQVYGAPGVPRADLNPRPLSPLTLSNGLVGCVSKDGSTLLATAWEPWQEVFFGIITCLHADIRLGGLAPGERKEIRGKLYILPADFPALEARYRRDFPAAPRRD